MTIPKETARQLATLTLTHGRPLLAVDADEVLVHFLCHFERFIQSNGLRLDVRQYSLEGALSDAESGRVLSLQDSLAQIDDFFERETLKQTAIKGAASALEELSEDFQIVILTNVPHAAKALREENLANLGIPFPVITNTGGKGPALHWLSEEAAAPTLFVDDSPQQIASARRDAKNVIAVQFIGCPMAQELIPVSEHQAIEAPQNWTELTKLLRRLASIPRRNGT